jgi:hypothetical protein
MAKSLRSKTKQAAGRKRRSDSHYAVAEAARIQRLSDKLLGEKSDAAKDTTKAEDVEVEGDDAEMKDGEPNYTTSSFSCSPLTDVGEEKKVSTSGPRRSGREEWKRSKGMTVKAHGRGKGTTQHGGSKNFKPKRRR